MNFLIFFAFLAILTSNFHALPASSVISTEEIADLELVSQSNGQPGGVLKALNNTITQAGLKETTKILTAPLTDIKTLQARQRLIKKLQDPALLSLIEKQLSIIARHENTITRCFDETYRTQLATTIKKNYYHWGSLKNLNSSAIALDIAHIFEFCALFGPLLEHLVLHFALEFLQEKMAHQAHHGRHTHHHAPAHPHNHDAHDDDNDNDDDDNDHHDGHAHHGHACISCLGNNASSKWVKNFFTVVKVGHFAFHLFTLKEMIEYLVNKAHIINLIHQEVISISACLNACARISDALSDADLNAPQCDAQALIKLCDIHTELIVKSLHESFFDDPDNTLSFWSRVGPTLSFYHIIGQRKDLIQGFLQSTGAIDACTGIAKLMLKNKDFYSFVDFVEGSDPYIHLENFFHPQISPDKAVRNTITLSAHDNSNKRVITGPNKAGKSSITKAIVVNLVLAQTFGIAAATAAQIAPIHKIVTYITIHDNLDQDVSTFLAEILRAEHALKILTSCDDMPTFALFDDSLFRSTQPEESARAAYRFIKKIFELKKNTALVVTHYEELTKFEAEMNGAVQNYHIDLARDKEGNFYSTFHLKHGISPRDAIFSIISNSRHQIDILQG